MNLTNIVCFDFFRMCVFTVDLTASFILHQTNVGGQRQEGQKDDTPVYPHHSASESVLYVLHHHLVSSREFLTIPVAQLALATLKSWENKLYMSNLYLKCTHIG